MNSPDDDLRSAVSFLAALPKVELHVHLLGSASVETIGELACRRPNSGVPSDPDELRRYFRFVGFDHFVDVYTAVNTLVTDGDDVLALVAGLGPRLVADSVRYAEVTVTPLSHLRAGVPAADLAAALTAGRRILAERHGVHVNWIFDVSGDDGVRGAFATLEWIFRHGPDGTVGFGLGGPERGVPRRMFRPAFDLARAHGLHCVPHAGETTDAGEVWSAVDDLGAERIGHGIRAVTDRVLLGHLAERGITLEICPWSNMCTGAVRTLDEHPLPALLAAGVSITLGTDDPAMFGTTLNREYERCHRRLGISLPALIDIAAAGVRAAFCPAGPAEQMLGELAALRDGIACAGGPLPVGVRNPLRPHA